MSSTQRFASLDDYPRQRQGDHWLCRWCGVPCPGRRTSYCSDPCAREVAIRTSNTGLRYYTFERDGGRCKDCALHAEWLRRELRQLYKADRPRWLIQISALGFTRKDALKSLWQADHILPVNAGGGQCGLLNIQTLCTRCHKAKTAEERMTTASKKFKKKLRKKAKPKKGVIIKEDGALTPPQVPKKVKHTPAPKLKKAKPTKFREKGLWLSAMSVRVEDVKKAHKTGCIDCTKMPKLRRLKVQKGAGRSATSEVYCADCGEGFLERMRDEAERAVSLLVHGETADLHAVRVADAQFERVKATHKARAAERKRKREAKKLAS